MASLTINHVSIKGITAAVPKDIVSNEDYPFETEQEKKLFIKTTGIKQKRLAPKGMTSSDLCYEAAQKLISGLSWKKEDIDVIIFVSQSPDYYLPATSIILQDRLGLSKNCMALDIGLGCSGYVYGLSVISSLLSNGLKKGILLVGDVSSATCNIKDKSTYPIFGDAGSATAIEFNLDAKPMHFHLNSNGAKHESILIPHGGLRNLISKDSFKLNKINTGIERTNLNLELNGLDVFNFSVSEIPKAILKFLENTDTSQDHYDYFVMHQANKLINETIRKKLKFTVEKTPYSLLDYGNTSSASIPLTIISQLKNSVSKNPKHLLITGFGVGLSWGVANLDLDCIYCPDILEL
jgi:3-oxoacyl-[acyl-carrier-protein] synthase-3